MVGVGDWVMVGVRLGLAVAVGSRMGVMVGVGVSLACTDGTAARKTSVGVACVLAASLEGLIFDNRNPPAPRIITPKITSSPQPRPPHRTRLVFARGCIPGWVADPVVDSAVLLPPLVCVVAALPFAAGNTGSEIGGLSLF